MVSLALGTEATISDVLDRYEMISGQHLLRDSAVQKSGLVLNISIVSKLTRSAAKRYLEAVLQLNGVSLVPFGDDMTKVILNPNANKTPRGEGLQIYTSSADFPTGDQVVTYFMQLRHIATKDAAKLFQGGGSGPGGGGPGGSSTSIIEVENAQALLLTGTVSVLNQFIALQHLIDVPPAKLERMVVQLHRADAERIAAQVTELLGGNQPAAPRTNRARAQTGAAPPAGGANNPPGAGNENATIPVALDDGPGMNERSLISGRFQLVADPRTNRIHVIARPSNFDFIADLIQTFDEPATVIAPYKRDLRYALAGELLPVLQDILTEGQETEGGGRQIDPRNTSRPMGNNQGMGQTTSASSGGLGRNGSIGSGASVSGEIELPVPNTSPEVITVGNVMVVGDNRSNSLLVLGPPEAVARVRSVVDLLDVKPRQVYLRTIIGQLSITNESEFGVDFLQKFARVGGDSGYASSQRTTTSAPIVDPTTLIATAAFPSALPAGLTSYIALGNTLDAYVRALEGTTRFKVISRPSLYAMNNKKAVILSGQQVPVPVNTLTNSNGGVENDTASVSATIDYKDVVLELAVIPLINANNEVTLSIVQKNDNALGNQTISGNQVPIISTQKINTLVTVGNNETVVLGGLIIEEDEKNVSGIPYVSRIPGLGHLFKNTAKNKRKSELIILIQPTIVEDALDRMINSADERELVQVAPSTVEYTVPKAPRAIPVETPKQRQKRKDYQRENYQ